jgi:2-polyprenyl-3-methyl-5-hydroxy-6-metoxy-1,4-benzoquinol methylase
VNGYDLFTRLVAAGYKKRFLMNTNTCYYCGSSNNRFYAEENGYRLVKCDGCGLLFVENRPNDEEISQAHKQGVHAGLKSLNVTGAYEAVKTAWYMTVLDGLFQGEAGGIKTWLDVGCGHGEFIEAVQQYAKGVAVSGSEPNELKQQSARKRGLNVGFFDIETHTGKYDLVSMLNVYSHLPDPPSFLEALKHILEPGGEMILETGDTAGLSAKDHYRPFYLPDHLSFASEAIVTGLLERLGFEIIVIRKYPLMQNNLKSIAKELVKAVLPQYTSRLKYYLNRKQYSETDMFIRARLKR